MLHFKYRSTIAFECYHVELKNMLLHRELKVPNAQNWAAMIEASTIQETLALLKIFALGIAEIEAGKDKPVGEVVARLRAKQTSN